MNFSDLRAGVYYATAFYYSKGRYYTHGVLGRFCEELASRVKELTVFAPVSRSESDQKGYPLTRRNISVIHLPFFRTYLQSLPHLARIWQIFRSNINLADFYWCDVPDPFGYFLYYHARRRGKIFFYEVRGDSEEIIRRGTKYSPWIRPLIILGFRIDFFVTRQVMRRCFTFVNGPALYEKLRHLSPNVHLVASSVLLESDFFWREDTCQKKPVRMLFVGFLRHEKRADLIVRSLKELREQGLDVTLEIVGDGPERGALESLVDSLQLRAAVNFHGYLVQGDRLNAVFNSCDLCVLASVSEGAPRVILEAMAHGLPMVSTPVGTAPEFIEKEKAGLLIEEATPRGIASAVRYVIEHPSFRREAIKRGYRIAREHTLAAFVDRVLTTALGALAQGRPQRGAGRAIPSDNEIKHFRSRNCETDNSHLVP